MSAARDISAAVAAVVAAVRDACADPADQVRALLALAALPGTGPVAQRARRCAVIALARAVRAYQPGSYDEALGVLEQVTDALDREVTAAGDLRQDASFQALRRLRVAVVRDMLARGASLAPLVAVEYPEPMPALVMAQRLYGDATRADELVRRLDPVHPAFMPTRAVVLAR